MTAGLLAALEATWPAAEAMRVGPWLVRRGLDGGKRASATSAMADWAEADIPAAEAAMNGFGQRPLFMLRPQDVALDQALAARGYAIVDPVTLYAGSVAALCEPPPPPLTSFAHWPGLRVTETIWDGGGIGPARRAVMARVTGPKAVVLGRIGDRAAGVAFVAAAGSVAMIHAIEVLADRRRQGVARNMIRGAAAWAADQGAQTLALAVTDANLPARALYAFLGMEAVGQYHYRARQGDA
jgi:GNAT superfamily N-acetyltransferase